MSDLAEQLGRGQPVRISERDKSGNLLRTWSHTPDNQVVLESKARTSLLPSMREVFMPVGYPHSVSSDYFNYQLFDSLQAFFSTITSLLANRALLQGLGVGDANSSATFAMFLTVLKDAVSRIATIVFAHRFGLRFKPDAKRFRFLADLFNDTAFFMELYSPYLGSYGKVLALTTGEALRALCGVAAGASKAALSVHFAKHDNLAELNAKEASQETAVGLIGLAIGTIIVHYVENHHTVVFLMTTLVLAHLWINYLGVTSVCMDNLNRQRATILFQEVLDTGKLLSPAEVSKRENILFWKPIVYNKAGDIATRIEMAGSYGEACASRCHETVTIHGNRNILFITPGHTYSIKIMLWEDSTAIHAISAWFEAMKMAWGMVGVGKEKTIPGKEGKEISDNVALWDQLRAKGWNLDSQAFETQAATRLNFEKDE
ncbi:uncharacterized protein FIESC28_11304 [Fusarium coffeatum]|uniref:Protein root UVB sensitive/RUS domain-containing protein n=1 Tax=Fusarium coffeatum TaxID=231269 RepID=A0A366QLI6_9HYPO|nr:uncharacterized protein FIESC28_11304 [Fusarium coffeatum]RBR05789.1 hypothetical protein FIESC28_11304 [Fusarium coffeatum]